MPAAERSYESAIENQQNALPAPKIRYTDFTSIEISESKVRCGLIEFDAIFHVDWIDRFHLMSL